MIGQYVEGKGWEVLCDNLGLLVGYVDSTPNQGARIARPQDSDYEIYCQEVYRIDKIDSIFILNENESTPTNTLIPYAVKYADRVEIEVNATLYNCYLSNTYINGATQSTLDDLYNNYLNLI
jgi:hypothetical protein